MENIEKLHLKHLLNALEFANENILSIDLLRIRNINIILQNEIKAKLNEYENKNAAK